MYLVRQPCGRAHTRTRSLDDLHAFHDGEAREVMPLSRVVLKVSQLACLKLYRRRKGCSEGVIVGLSATRGVVSEVYGRTLSDDICHVCM